VPRIDGHKYARGHASCCPATWLHRRGAAGGARGAAGRGRAGDAGLAARCAGVNASALTAVMVRAVDTAVEFADMLDDSGSMPA
jgi:hypothetical protein